MLLALLLAAGPASAAGAPQNHLTRELSPYLRQRAADAIEWFPWGADALQTARTRNRPLLVVIGHSGCHACQALDRMIVGDPALVAAVNERFVAVRVDREERPDVEDALRTSTASPAAGDSEPLVVVLNAFGLPIKGGRHPEPVAGREEFREWLSAFAGAARAGAGMAPPQDEPQAPLRVPPFGRLRLLLAESEAGDAESRRLLIEILDAIARGGIRDHVGGGFHHGTRDGAWRLPWYEKLLCDNALLLRTYAQAFALTKDLVYRDVVKETVAWAIRELRDSTGAFLTSVNVATEDREGRFYLWTRDEILATLGKERGEEFLAVYRIEAPGVLQLAGSPFAGLGSSRDVLQVRRGRRVRPSVDDKVLAGWNGQMIGALATSGALVRRGSDVEAARRTAGSVLERLGPARTLRHYAVGGEARGSASLEDYAYLAEGLLDLHEATKEARWREEASALADAAVTRFWDVSRGGFFATDGQHAPVPLRLKPALDGPLPSANGVMAAVLLRLGQLTGQERFTRLGGKTLEAFPREAARTGKGGETLRAAARLLPGPRPTPQAGVQGPGRR